MFVSLSSSKMIIPVYLVALFCTVVLGRSAEKDQQNPEDLAINRDTSLVSPQSRKTDPRLDVKIAHQPGQPDEPHPEIFPSVDNVGKDAPGKSELIGEAKSELLESAPVPVPHNPDDALSSRSRRFFLPYLSSSYRRPYYRRPYVRGAYYPYYFGGIFGYPYYGAGYTDHMVTVTTAEDTTVEDTTAATAITVGAMVIMEGGMVTSISESTQIIN
ncbi:hypothetical protein DAPPUDRAFT_320075 [Daphnia pulex]|uniref:Uncharacterized protein n=1 Tax=Daphnia pulex TaxID=6669 RepID=E9GNS1_DAPPU|nr:hypothetical protein DAPPUDRAFT_320075 [Daphnia pulex]|eukprot:EFX78904.1 hypothetical protein DAPPUDRAFT_320075 [Daphnia pulex]